MQEIAVDFETPYGKDFSVVDLGYDRYARDPRCVPYLIAVCDGSESWAGEPKDFNFESLRGATLLSHNAAFDQEIALAAKERGLFEIPDIQPFGMTHWHCTLNLSAYLWNVRSLKDACKHGLGIDVSKDVRDRAKDKTVDDMKREGWWDDMLRYGIRDAQYCRQLWGKHGAQWPQLERDLSQQTIEQGRYGVRIDVPALNRGIEILRQVIFKATQNLPWVARGRAPASPLGIAEECRACGIPPMPVKTHDPEAAEAWEAEYAPKFPFVYALRSIRKAKKSLATLETIKLRLRPDNTVAFSLKYAGAHTLRWAGDSGWNLQNQNKEPLFFDPAYSFIFDKEQVARCAKEFDAEQAGKAACGELKDGTLFFDFRGLIIPPEGMKLAPVDLSQIEPRVLNTIIGNKELLDLIRQGMAIYEAFARKSLGWTGGELKVQDKKLYALSKSELLGLGFRMGWEKFIAAAWALARVDITEGDEDFAKAAAIDGKIYERQRQPHRSVERPGEFQWVYSDCPPECEESLRKNAHAVLDPLGLLPNLPVEKCVFVQQKRTVRGEEKTIISALPIYGMRSRVTVAEFRKNNPLNAQFWEMLDRQIELTVENGRKDLEITGPHGGKLIYRNVRRESREVQNKETGEKYARKVYTAEIGGKRYVIHGGIITENIVQWIARMCFAERQLDLHRRLQAEDPRQRVLFTVHDEAVPQILDPGSPEKCAERARWIESVLSISPEWLPEIPMGAECKVVGRYLK